MTHDFSSDSAVAPTTSMHRTTTHDRRAPLMAAPALVAWLTEAATPLRCDDQGPRRRGQGDAPDLRVETAFLELSKPPSTRSSTAWSRPGSTRSSSSPSCSPRPATPRSTSPARSLRRWPVTRASGSTPAASSAWRPPSSRCSTSGSARRSRTPASASSTPSCSLRPARPTRSPTSRSPASPARWAARHRLPVTAAFASATPPATGEAVRALRGGQAARRRRVVLPAPGRLPTGPPSWRSRRERSRCPTRSAPTRRSPRDPRSLRRGRGRAGPV